MATITFLLERAKAGDEEAHGLLFTTSYAELKRLARAHLRDGGRNTVMDTTALVHESHVRFVHSGQLRAGDRKAFFAYVSKVMRSVVVDTARERLAERRGGDVAHLALTTQMAANMAGGERIPSCVSTKR